MVFDKSVSGLNSGYVLGLDEDPRSLSKEVKKKILTTAYAMGRDEEDDERRSDEHAGKRNKDSYTGQSEGRDDVDGMYGADVTIDFSDGREVGVRNAAFDNQIITQTLSTSINDPEDDMDTPLISPESSGSARKRILSAVSSPKGSNRFGRKVPVYYQEEDSCDDESVASLNKYAPLNSSSDGKKKMNFLQRLSNLSSIRKKKRRSSLTGITFTEPEVEREKEKSTPFVLDVSIISESSVESDNDIDVDPSSNGFCFDVADGLDL